MAQQFQVLRCCSCNTFQVQQIKKSKKWNCKICDEKQSILKVFGQGSGSDCRRHVQKLNLLQGERYQTSINKLRFKEELAEIGEEDMAVNVKEKLGWQWQDKRNSVRVGVKSFSDSLCESVIPVTEDQVLQKTEPRLARISKWKKFLPSGKSYDIDSTTTIIGGRPTSLVETTTASNEETATSSGRCSNWHLELQQNAVVPSDSVKISDPDRFATGSILGRSKQPTLLASCQDKALGEEFATVPSVSSHVITKSSYHHGSLFSTGDDFDDDV